MVIAENKFGFRLKKVIFVICFQILFVSYGCFALGEVASPPQPSPSATPILVSTPVTPLSVSNTIKEAQSQSKGAIVWDTTKINVTGKDRRDILVKYSGKNTSSSSVYVRGMELTCPCLVAHLPNRTIAAGERFDITFKYGVRDAGGKMTHPIDVYVEEGKEKKLVKYDLSLSVDVPVLYVLEDRRHDWKLGSMDTKVSKLIIPKSTGINLVSARIFGHKPGLFELKETQKDLGDSIEHTFEVVPMFASSLSPKRGAMGAVGLLLSDGKNQYKDLIQLINWPIPQPP